MGAAEALADAMHAWFIEIGKPKERLALAARLTTSGFGVGELELLADYCCRVTEMCKVPGLLFFLLGDEERRTAVVDDLRRMPKRATADVNMPSPYRPEPDQRAVVLGKLHDLRGNVEAVATDLGLPVEVVRQHAESEPKLSPRKMVKDTTDAESEARREQFRRSRGRIGQDAR